MRITDIRADLLSSPMPEPIRMTYHGGERTIFKRDAALVRITTDRGCSVLRPTWRSYAASGKLSVPTSAS